jgi:hypothetical protein
MVAVFCCTALDSSFLLIQIWIGYTEFSFVGTNVMLTKTATAALAVGTSLLGFAAPASAATVLIFAQNHSAPPGFVVLHDNGNGTTSLSTSIAVTITDLAGPLVPPPITDATFTLTGLSDGAAHTIALTPTLSLFTQEFSGSFSITTPTTLPHTPQQCGTTGLCLSGTFTDAVMSGFLGGFALTLFDSTPPTSGLAFASDPLAIPASALADDRAMSLAKTDLTSPVTDDCSSPVGCTLGTTSANVSGTFSATPGTVPESSTWVMMILGFAGLGAAGFRSSRTKLALID